MKTQVLALSCIILCSCHGAEPDSKGISERQIQKDSASSKPELQNLKPETDYKPMDDIDTCNTAWDSKYTSYQAYKTACQNLKVKLKTEYLATPDSLKEGKLLDISREWGNMMVKQGTPFWLGTPWTFEGHTAVPNEGTVACGYLVSTLLAHSGLNINRYYLAQQSAYNGAKTLNCTGETPKRYYLNNIYGHIDTLPEGLYSVGLAYHVGYLWKEKNESYFIHSNYILEEGVVIEQAECSDAFNTSNLFLIIPISGNLKLSRKWLFSEKVEVIRA
jgi:hypothetical protein